MGSRVWRQKQHGTAGREPVTQAGSGFRSGLDRKPSEPPLLRLSDEKSVPRVVGEAKLDSVCECDPPQGQVAPV